MGLLYRFLKLKNPLLGVGAAFFFVAFVHASTSSVSPNHHPSYPLGVVGIILLGFGGFLQFRQDWIREARRFKDRVLYDASFWQQAFDAMPPAFIKAVSADQDTYQAKHIAESHALSQIQGRDRPGDPADEERKIIRADHQRGDEEALTNGESRYLESIDTYGTNPARQILTLKTAFEHGGRTFVVGWFITVELPETIDQHEHYHAKETSGQVTFGLIGAPDEGIKVRIGDSARRAAEKRRSRRTENPAL